MSNDQNSPSAATPIWNAGFTGSYNTAANTAGHALKAGAGVFGGINVNTAGVTSTFVAYDGVDTGGKKLGTFDTTKIGPSGIPLQFTAGLFIVLTGGTPADVTVVYR